MVSKRTFSLGLMLAVSAVLLYFLSSFLFALSTYFALREKVAARVSRWEVEEVGGKYAIKATYAYEVQGKIWEAETMLAGPLYWNELAAISALREKAKESQTAWYCPKNPARSTLEKTFPHALFVKTLICFGILIYFYFLKNRLLNIF